MKPNWGGIRSEFQKITGAMFIDEEPEASQSKQQLPSASSIRESLLDSQINRSMLQSKAVNQSTIGVFESKYIKAHYKRTSKWRTEIIRLIDAFERKANDLLRVCAEQRRLEMYNNLITAQLKRTKLTTDFTFQKTQKEIQKITVEYVELALKHDRLVQQAEQNKKCLDEIKDFWLLVMRSLKNNIQDFDVETSKLDPESLRDFRRFEGSLTSLQRFTDNPVKVRPNSMSVVRSSKTQLSAIKSSRRSTLTRDRLIYDASSSRKMSQSLKRRSTPMGILIENLIIEQKSDFKPVKKPIKVQSARTAPPMLLLNNSSKAIKSKFFNDSVIKESRVQHRRSGTGIRVGSKSPTRPSSQAPLETFDQKWLPENVVIEENDALSDKKSITSSIGSSVYREILEEGPKVALFSPSGRIIESKQNISVEQKTKKGFIPVKISFKIGPDSLPSQIKTTYSGERIYNSLQFKRLEFYLSPDSQICGLQFTFVNRLTKAVQDGMLHGKIGPISRSIELNDEEFLNMAHFQNDTSGIRWIKLFTSRGLLEVGSEITGQAPSGVRYFPREVKLCKLFVYFNSPTDVLAQIRFIYVRTVYY